MGGDVKPLPPLAQIPPQIAAVADYEAFARERMTPGAWSYFSGGAGDEHTLRDNLAAFQRIRLRSRVLRPVAGGHTRVSLLGDEYEHPILLAPVAFQQLAHRDGEFASVLGASAMKAGMVVSTQSSVALEDLAQAAQTRLWFQVYLQHDRDFTAQLVARAHAAGYRALVLTVDAPVNGPRNREQRDGFALPAGVEAVNLRGMAPPPAAVASAGGNPLFGGPLLAHAPTWDDVAWLRSLSPLPVVLKGILSPDDARRAVEAGASAIVVSNHGGRTLDTAPATIDALPAIAREVGGRVPLLLDGGIRRGTDVLKALALGADAVLVGRPCVHALAAAGAVGVAHVLHLLRAELEMAMALTGCRTLADIDESVIWPGDVPP